MTSPPLLTIAPLRPERRRLDASASPRYRHAMRALLPVLLLVATFSFALGVTLPLLTLERLFVFSEQPSLVGMVAALADEGDWALAGVIALFSIVLPAAKLYLIHRAAYLAAGERPDLPAWVSAVSKWSMLDVVLVAIVIFAAKTSGLASAVTSPGLWFFALSVAATAVAGAVIGRDLQHPPKEERH